jgi:hypothetical protein
MKQAAFAMLAGLILLAGCGAESPPRIENGVDLARFWGNAE